ncbi:GntR family transcriptional regulator [Methylobacterium oryzisoli]|uniref:GntR family transcriptional regulator n=1 Tax=Methylobacterium oryzisoli TaxID=3385502 RepID=UPI003891DD72
MGAVVSLGEAGGPAGETVGQVLYGRIRTDIIFGRLAPGERLRLDAFSQRYGASVSTMREMLSRLVSEGLIVAEGQRGFQVASVSPEEFRELAELRLLIEQHAQEKSIKSGDLDWEASVVAAYHKLSVTETKMLAGEDVDPELWKRCDREFHQALIEACGSRAIMATHTSVYDRYLRYQMIAVVFRGEVAAREHAELLDCALKRDWERGATVLRSHINNCVDYALADPSPSWANPPSTRGRTSEAARSKSSRRNPSGRA